MSYWATLYRLPRAQIGTRTVELLERVGLAGKADERVETYSRGMRQRLHLARGLIADAAVLFLDEPTTGMDPMAAREMRTLIGDLRTEGRTILLATHDMLEAEMLCNRVTLMDRGHVIATESPRSLARLISQFQRVDIEGADATLLDRIDLLPGVVRVDRDADGARIHVDDENTLSGVLKVLVENGITAVRTSRPSLEEVYVGLIGDRGLDI